MIVNKIVVLVELDDGTCHQVLTTKERKEVALHLLDIDGQLRLDRAIEPIEFRYLEESC